MKWDRDLCATKTFLTAVLILAGRKYNSSKLDSQQEKLLKVIDRPAINYLRLGLLQGIAFKERDKNLVQCRMENGYIREEKMDHLFRDQDVSASSGASRGDQERERIA